MTQAGKCDTCRARKVKCDEKKPKCGACRKKDRSCTYTFGRVAALVLEDPNQFSGHGKAKVTPRIVPLFTGRNDKDAGSNISNVLLVTEQTSTQHSRATSSSLREAGPMYLPTTMVTNWKPKMLLQPSNTAYILTSRYTSMLGRHDGDCSPLAIYGSWIALIPNRIGHSQVLDSAIDFMLNSFATFWDASYTKQKTARVSKAMALKELRTAIEQGKSGVDDNVLLATMLHFCAEVYMGIENFAWVLHVLGLSKMLNQSDIAGADRIVVWSLVDSLYMDEVSEAMLDARPSVYDTQFYLSCTNPKIFALEGRQVPVFEQVSRTVMHLLIQIPRLVCWVRRALSDTDGGKYLSLATALAASLYETSTFPPLQKLLQASTTVVHMPASDDIADLVPDSLCFDIVPNLLLFTRFWRFRIFLCAVVQNLHDHFPGNLTLAILPHLDTVCTEDVKAAVSMVQSFQSALSFSPTLQLVSLRILSSLQVSVGTWSRIIARHSNLSLTPVGLLDGHSHFDNVNNAQRMRDWVIENTNRIHDMWGVPHASAPMFDIVLSVAAGNPIPDWLPRRMDLYDIGLESKEILGCYDATTMTPASSAKEDNHKVGTLFRSVRVEKRDIAGSVDVSAVATGPAFGWDAEVNISENVSHRQLRP